MGNKKLKSLALILLSSLTFGCSSIEKNVKNEENDMNQKSPIEQKAKYEEEQLEYKTGYKDREEMLQDPSVRRAQKSEVIKHIVSKYALGLGGVVKFLDNLELKFLDGEFCFDSRTGVAGIFYKRSF